ncbi:hypothetical protein QL285_036768 [Trifolium repens]|nr:hypothetical protein QL285_036768 [Trifolium repens]
MTLSTAAHFCVSDCGEAESAHHHLFISCGTFGSIWALVHLWIGTPVLEYTSLRDHFVQFTFLADSSRTRRFFCSLFGSRVFGSYGQRETTYCSEARQALLISYWTRSNSFLSDG